MRAKISRDLPRPGDAPQQAPPFVEADQGRRLLRVHRESPPDRLLPIVVPLVRLAPAGVADALPPAWGRNARDTSPRTVRQVRRPAMRDHQILAGDFQAQDVIQAEVELPERRLQRLGLRHGAGKAVQDVAAGAIRGLQPLPHQTR